MLEVESKFVVSEIHSPTSLRTVLKTLRRSGFHVKQQPSEKFEDIYFESQIKQRTRRLQFQIDRPELPDSLVNLSLDRVKLKCKGLRYGEIELALASGPESVLRTVAALIHDLPGLTPSRMSKFDRVRFAIDPSPTSMLPVPADTQTWQQLGIAYLEVQMQRIEYYAPFASEGILCEGVHQLRVATRRVLAALRAFDNVLPRAESRLFRKHIRALTKQLGSIRDCDVHLNNLAKYHVDPHYVNGLVRQRECAHQQLTSALTFGAISTVRIDFDNLLAVMRSLPASNLSARDGAIQQVLPTLNAVERQGRRTRRIDAQRLHKLRLKVKTLAYQLECAVGVPPGLINATSELQDVLGHHQDARVATERLRAAEENTTSLIHHFKGKARSARKEFGPAWARFISELEAFRRIPR